MQYPVFPTPTALLLLAAAMLFSADFAQSQERKQLNAQHPRYTYVRRNDSVEGDEKVVTVPGINARQAMLDAQTYNVGWNAVDVWAGQTRIMYNVLLKKRAPYVRGTPPISYPVPGEKKLPRRR